MRSFYSFFIFTNGNKLYIKQAKSSKEKTAIQIKNTPLIIDILRFIKYTLKYKHGNWTTKAFWTSTSDVINISWKIQKGYYSLSWLVSLWYLTPHSTIFQLYHGGQCYCWRKPEYPVKTTDLSQVTDKLNNV